MDEWCHGSYSKNNKETFKYLITRNHLFNKEKWYTYLSEIGSIINSRPLTFLSEDINDFEALTPNYFLTGTVNPNVLICPVKKPVDIANKQNWKSVQVTLTSFWD